jgi:hypothetical protein
LIYANNPEAAGRKLLNRTVQARWAAPGLLETWECVPIPMARIRFRPSMRTETCFKFLPINTTILGKPFEGFLDPLRLILSATSPTGTCEKYRIHYFRVPSSNPGINWQFMAIDQTTGKMPTATPNVKSLKMDGKLSKFPTLHPIIFHQVLHSPLTNFIPAEHSEAQLAFDQQEQAKINWNKNGYGPIEFLNLGQVKKDFDEVMGHIGFWWQLLINVYCSFQIGCTIYALIVLKVKHDQWLWQRYLGGGGNSPAPVSSAVGHIAAGAPEPPALEKQPNAEDTSSTSSRPRRGRFERVRCGLCRGSEGTMEDNKKNKKGKK